MRASRDSHADGKSRLICLGLYADRTRFHVEALLVQIVHALDKWPVQID